MCINSPSCLDLSGTGASLNSLQLLQCLPIIGAQQVLVVRMNECINAWLLVIAGDASPGRELRVGTWAVGVKNMKLPVCLGAWDKGACNMV